VIQYDVDNGIPYPEHSFDVVYHSHVLEHFKKQRAQQFVGECYRVLKPGGIIRVVVPDLEQIAQIYLQALEKAAMGENGWDDNYNWMMLELYDQAVRNVSGGEMLAFLKREFISNRGFIVERCGVEVDSLMERFEQKRSAHREKIVKKTPSGFSLHSWTPQQVIGRFREHCIKILLGSEYEALKVGRFRCSGENHQWMYDRYSLSGLLHEVGFQSVEMMKADKSNLPNWAEFCLDTEADGGVYKPDSLYMEARRK
jgi:predicted SAM-dependent methyltransferase